MTHERPPRRRSTAAAVVATCLTIASAPSRALGERPNLLIIHTDQLSSWAISAYAPLLKRTPNYGRTVVETPHIDRLAREGVMLANYFVNSAVCTPSRGCLFTGRYPHAHGAYRNNVELHRDEVTLAHVLKRHGYETGYSGKWHLDGTPKPGFVRPDRAMGFDDSRYMFNRGHWKKIVDKPDGGAEVSPYRVLGDEKTYTTDWLAGKTIEFIRHPRAKPFFYVVSFPDPHGPFTVREPYMTMYRPEDMPVPRTFSAGEGRRGRRSRRSKLGLQKQKARYCGLVKCIDDNVGRIRAALESREILDRTVIVFTTDHGEYMGEHNLMGKNQWYRTAYRVPLLVRWPEKVPAGRTIDRFVTSVDVQPTLLALMGFEPRGREQGNDASPLLRGEKVDWKDVAWLHHSSLKGAGILTPKYELVLKQSGEHLLFDRGEDPEQTRNIVNEAVHRAAMNRLAQRVVDHHRRVQSPAIEWLQGILPAETKERR